jgi:hypothetical protein
VHYVISVTKKKIPSYTICGAALWQRDFDSEYNFLPQGIKMEQFFARSFHLKKYVKLFLLDTTFHVCIENVCTNNVFVCAVV